MLLDGAVTVTATADHEKLSDGVVMATATAGHPISVSTVRGRGTFLCDVYLLDLEQPAAHKYARYMQVRQSSYVCGPLTIRASSSDLIDAYSIHYEYLNNANETARTLQ